MNSQYIGPSIKVLGTGNNLSNYIRDQIKSGIKDDIDFNFLERRVTILEAVQRNTITRAEGDNLLSMLSSGNSNDVNLALELINNLGK